MSQIAVIARERFEAVPLDIYGNGLNEFYMTRQQIGQALGYANPQKAIDNIHTRNKDRLDPLSVTLKLGATDGKMYDTTIYSFRGVCEICRWSRQPKADAFMDFVWDILEKLLKGEPLGQPPPAEYLEACGVIQQLPEAPTDEDIARQFLQALQTALSSGRYYLLPKGKHSRLERPGRLLGHYDDAVITLICSEAYSIYADAPASYTLSRSVAQTLRPALARCGLALPRTKKDGKRRIHGRECSTIRLDRGLADAMSGFKPALAFRKRAALKA